MKKSTLLLIIPILIISISYPAHAFWNRDVKKAKEFMEVDMYPEAVELLKKRISEKPTDEEAHYLLGTCYLHQGSFRSANESFDRAVKLKPKYGKQIGEKYKEIGIKQFDSGKVRSAVSSFDNAGQYDKSLSKEIALICYEKGIEYNRRGKIKEFVMTFGTALRFYPEYDNEGAEFQYCMGDYYNQTGKTNKAEQIFTNLSNNYSEDEIGRGRAILKISSKKWKVFFFTDKPTNIFNWQAGKTITFSGFLRNDEVIVYASTGEKAYPMAIDNTITAGRTHPLIIKYKSGGIIKMVFK